MGQWATLFTITAAPHADDDADHASGDADKDRFDQELRQDVDAPWRRHMRRPISRVRSVTDTYMMFMMPIPPTTSEMPAMQASSVVIRSVVEFSIGAEFLLGTNREVVVVTRLQLVVAAQDLGDFVDGLVRHVLGEGRGEDAAEGRSVPACVSLRCV